MDQRRRAAIFTPSIPSQWLERIIGSADYEADTARYTVVSLTPHEYQNATLALPHGYTLELAPPGRYPDDTEGAVLVGADGSVSYVS